MESAITPTPTDAEAAAIAAAVEVLWPSVGGPANGIDSRRGGVWRFSGRWWSQPIPLRRARPWM
ncbi:MAG: hypothetical protein ACK5OX_16925 [Desertimonas sp.]